LSTKAPTAAQRATGDPRPLRRQGGASGPRTLAPEALVEHLDRLYRAAWALCGSREDAEDLVQETCARVLKKRRLVRSEDDFGYLLRALRNTYFSTRKRTSRRPRVTNNLEGIDVPDPETETQPEQALASHDIYAAIAELPEPFRLAVVAVDVLELSYRDAARTLHAREATITTRLYRGRQRLACALQVRSDAVSPPGPGPGLAPSFNH
jgi:RNA polymerase sigma-70 factor (ECF subfamily)